MHPNEFDKALRDRYDSGSLPPDLAQWEQLVNRLDEYESAAVPPPAQASRRRILAFWPVWAAAASVLLVGWLFLQRSETPVTVHTTPPAPVLRPAQGGGPVLATTQAQPRLVPDAPAPPADASRKPVALVAATRNSDRRTPVSPLVQVPVTPQAPVQQPEAVAANQPERHSGATRSQEPRAAAPQVAGTTAPRYPQVNLAQAGPGEDFVADDPEERRRLSVDLNGGYGPGSLKRNYALGVSVNRKVSERLRVEAGVAVVSGTYQAFNSAGADAFRAGVEAPPENTTSRLTYIQAAPGVTYEVVPGLFAGAGVDAQRLLTAAEDAKGYSYSGEELEAQPAWDFGYTVRAGYKLNRHIKAGLQYRNSMHGTAPVAGTNVQPRNYLLFQLGYTIR